MNVFGRSVFIVTLSMEVIVGTVGNGFVVLVNCVDLVKRRKISPVDQMLTTLAISRISQLCSVVIIRLVSVIYPGWGRLENTLGMISVTWTVTNHLSMWLATCLSIFYFLKVAYFSNPIFLYLKWRVKKVVLLTLLMSLVVLFLNGVVVGIPVYVWIDGFKRNVSSSLRNSTWSSKLFLFTNSMFALIPFTLSLAAFLLLILSLCKHLKKMKQTIKGFRDASMVAHLKAMQTGTAFVLLYTMFLLFLVTQISRVEHLDNELIVSLDHTMGGAFSSGHSVVLILGNSKLRQASTSVLWWLRGRYKGARPAGP